MPEGDSRKPSLAPATREEIVITGVVTRSRPSAAEVLAANEGIPVRVVGPNDGQEFRRTTPLRRASDAASATPLVVANLTEAPPQKRGGGTIPLATKPEDGFNLSLMITRFAQLTEMIGEIEKVSGISFEKVLDSDEFIHKTREHAQYKPLIVIFRNKESGYLGLGQLIEDIDENLVIMGQNSNFEAVTVPFELNGIAGFAEANDENLAKLNNFWKLAFSKPGKFFAK